MSNEEMKVLEAEAIVEEAMLEDELQEEMKLKAEEKANEEEPIKISRLEAEMLNMERGGCPKLLTYKVGINGYNSYSLDMELDPSVENPNPEDEQLLIQDVIKANAFIRFAMIQNMIDRHHMERVGVEQGLKEAKQEAETVYTKEDIEQAIAGVAWMTTLINSMSVKWTMNMLIDFKNRGFLEGITTSDIDNWSKILIGSTYSGQSEDTSKNVNEESLWGSEDFKELPLTDDDNIEASEERTVIPHHEEDLTLLDELKNCYTISAKHFLHYFPECDFANEIETRDSFAKMHADDILATVKATGKTYTVKEFAEYVIKRLNDVNPEATPDKDFKTRLWYLTLNVIHNIIEIDDSIDLECETLNTMADERSYRLGVISSNEEIFLEYPLYPEEVVKNEDDECIINLEELLNISKRFVPEYKDAEYVYRKDTALYQRIKSVNFNGKEYSLDSFIEEVLSSLAVLNVETEDIEDKEFKTRKWYTTLNYLFNLRKDGKASDAYAIYVEEDGSDDIEF